MNGDGKTNPMNPAECRAWSTVKPNKKIMKTAKEKAQQGDVCMRLVSEVSEAAAVISLRRCVLADGEHTGHQHLVEDEEAQLIKDGERMLLKLGRAATVFHPEHKPIRLSPGIWEIGRVQEYDYLAELTRNVAD